MAAWINGGFFVLSPKAIDYIDGDAIELGRRALDPVAADGQLQVYTHKGFWQAMDTLRDKNQLEEHVAARRRQMEGLGLSFWAGKRVLLTGHTGFKGSWMSLWLLRLGVRLTGYALEPATRAGSVRSSLASPENSTAALATSAMSKGSGG